MLVLAVVVVAAVVLVLLMVALSSRGGPVDEIEQFQRVRDMTTRWSEEHRARQVSGRAASYPDETPQEARQDGDREVDQEPEAQGPTVRQGRARSSAT